MMQKIRDFALPGAIVLGFLFHSFFAKLNVLTPYLIFVMLFFTLTSVNVRHMRVSMLHVWILLFQVAVSLGVYWMLVPVNELLAQGALIIILAPTATSAPVVAAMLGANLNTMVTSTMLSNFAIAAVAPFYFAQMGSQIDLPFWQSSWQVLSRVLPLIILPFVLAVGFQKFLPKTTAKINKRKSISFYLWAFGLTIVIGSTIDYIYIQDRSKNAILLVLMLASILSCAVQFAFGRWVGRKYGDRIAGGQALGQKNTVLAIWMAHTYLNPLSSVVPATYAIWQNLFNSYQIWEKGRKERLARQN
jgi:bile acid:Na+ symporter, BASS family